MIIFTIQLIIKTNYMKYFFTLILFVFTFSAFSQYEIGHQSFSFDDVSRNNRTVTGEIYYPSDVAGDNVGLAAGEFPFIVFGHGFGMSWSEYLIWWETLVAEGYIIAFPTTEGSVFPFPSHGDFGEDLAFVIDSYMNENSNTSSDFFESMSGKNAVMGHSMGGGCSYLARGTFNANIETIITMAAADTDPSAIAAAANIDIPVLTLAGSEDCVVMAGGAPIDIYNGLTSTPYKAYVEITDASHCQFGIASTGSLCTLGEFCGGFLSLSVQHTQMFLSAKPWLDYFLKGDCDAWEDFKDNLENNTTHTYQEAGDDYTLELEIFEDFNGTPFTLEINNISGGNTYTYQWYVDGLAVNGSTSSSIDPFSTNIEGNYTLEVTNEYGCSILSNEIFVLYGSILNPSATFGLNVYPTIVENEITIVLENEMNLESEISIIDISGRIISSINKTLIPNVPLKIETGVFPKGIYFLQVHSNEGILSKKFFKN